MKQSDLLDAGQGFEGFGDAEVDSLLMEFPLQQGNHEQGQHAVEGVYANLLIGPVEAG